VAFFYTLQIPPNLLPALRSLQFFSIENNMIEALPNWSSNFASPLKAFIASGNRLRSVPSTLIRACCHLKMLELAQNQIKCECFVVGAFIITL
jgi:Leucine-rich repeat (LRR) protein